MVTDSRLVSVLNVMPGKSLPPLPVPVATGTSLAGLNPTAGLVPAGDSSNVRISARRGRGTAQMPRAAINEGFIGFMETPNGGPPTGGRTPPRYNLDIT